ncbi:MAG: TetR/AcrR family transcriptional regulator [Beijerinckiaceae bacterium]
MSTNLTKEHISEVVNERRRQQRAVDKRERILEAAFEEFAERGFEGASTRSVAAKAGVQHPLVTYHFGSKEGLWKAVVTNASFNFSEHFKEHIESDEKDQVERLRRIQEAFIRFAAANPHFHWLMSHEGNRESERLTWLVEERVQNYFDQVAALIRIAQRQGRYVDGDPYHLQYLFIGAVTRLYMLSAEVKQVTGKSPHSRAFVNEHIRACLSLFFRDPPVAARRKRVTTRSART